MLLVSKFKTVFIKTCPFSSSTRPAISLARHVLWLWFDAPASLRKNTIEKCMLMLAFSSQPCKSPFPLASEIVLPPKNPCFQDLCSPYLVRKKAFASMHLLEHKPLEVFLFIYGLEWKKLEPSFRTVSQQLQVVTNFYVVNNKTSIFLVQFYLLIHVFNEIICILFLKIFNDKIRNISFAHFVKHLTNLRF
jgi:hypothetical protein